MARPLARFRVSMIVALSLTCGLALVSAAQAPSQPPADTRAPPQQPPSPAQAPQAAQAPELPPPQTLTEALLREVAVLHAEIEDLRAQLAQAQLDAHTAQRELGELRQFVLDQQRFGDDFQQYRAVKEIAEREARERENEQARQQREVDKAQRNAQRAAARAAREQQNAVANRVAAYKRMGFTHLGLDVYTSKMAFHYNTKDAGGGVRVDYDTLLGNYLRPYPPIYDIDYSKMTISGSVLNASEITRNLGVAITFFDENGNQVGHETVQINNARPDVPYPFTSTIDMALNRPFASSSTYVLYADAVE